jgi:hypothetical protein
MCGTYTLIQTRSQRQKYNRAHAQRHTRTHRQPPTRVQTRAITHHRLETGTRGINWQHRDLSSFTYTPEKPTTARPHLVCRLHVDAHVDEQLRCRLVPVLYRLAERRRSKLPCPTTSHVCVRAYGSHTAASTSVLRLAALPLSEHWRRRKR